MTSYVSENAKIAVQSFSKQATLFAVRMCWIWIFFNGLWYISFSTERINHILSHRASTCAHTHTCTHIHSTLKVPPPGAAPPIPTRHQREGVEWLLLLRHKGLAWQQQCCHKNSWDSLQLKRSEPASRRCGPGPTWLVNPSYGDIRYSRPIVSLIQRSYNATVQIGSF